MIWLGIAIIPVILLVIAINIKRYGDVSTGTLITLMVICVIMFFSLLASEYIPPIAISDKKSTTYEITEFKKVISDNNEESYVYTTNKTEVHSARVEDKRDKRKDGAITSIDLVNSNPSKLIVKEYECLRLVDFSMIKNHEYIFI